MIPTETAVNLRGSMFNWKNRKFCKLYDITIYNEVGNLYITHTATNSMDQVLLRKLFFVISSRNSRKFIEPEVK